MSEQIPSNPASSNSAFPIPGGSADSIRFPIERRRFPRFEVKPMYTSVSVRLLDSERFTEEGHGYDISEGGCRFELDRAIAPGTGIAMQIMLPTMQNRIGGKVTGPGRAVFVFGNVVWLEDDAEPGPARMAVAFTRFARQGDRERLLGELRTGHYKAAA